MNLSMEFSSFLNVLKFLGPPAFSPRVSHKIYLKNCYSEILKTTDLMSYLQRLGDRSEATLAVCLAAAPLSSRAPE